MKLHTIDAENLKLDGGSCFGVVPKVLWQKLVKPDENNLIDVSIRNLLVEDGNRLILIDTGMGNKQSEKFYNYNFRSGVDNMINSFARLGLNYEDVTDVILTHLHFDHCGGAVTNEQLAMNNEQSDLQQYRPTFRNARYYCSKAQWEKGNNPYAIEKASYHKENYVPLMEAGVLTLVEDEMQFSTNIFLKFVHGHTAGQMIPIIDISDLSPSPSPKEEGGHGLQTLASTRLVFMADFISSTVHIHLPYIPAFDYEPLKSLKEKEAFLKIAAENNYILFFQHDFETECCTVKQTEKGVVADKMFRLEEISS